MSQVGYVRVSTAVQDGALQRDALTKAGCTRLFEDRASGAKSDRPGLNAAFYSGTIGARHGRSGEQMQAISGALTLLANVVMAWNTYRIQSFRDQKPDELADNVVAQLAPISHAHINMRGVISFHLEKAAKGLIVPSKGQVVPVSYIEADS